MTKPKPTVTSVLPIGDLPLAGEWIIQDVNQSVNNSASCIL